MAHKDALGNEIVIGNWYGYSRNDGGRSHVTVGQAIKTTDKTVRLGNCKVNLWLYGDPCDHYRKLATEVSIRSDMIFPVPAPQNVSE
jgi:hypothetical protein